MYTGVFMEMHMERDQTREWKPNLRPEGCPNFELMERRQLVVEHKQFGGHVRIRVLLVMSLPLSLAVSLHYLSKRVKKYPVTLGQSNSYIKIFSLRYRQSPKP